jgi:hypothetical protein
LPIRAEVNIKISGAQCNLIISRIKPLILFKSAKKKPLVLHEIPQQEKAPKEKLPLALVLAFDIFKVLLAGRIRTKLTPRNIHVINRIGGMILIGFAIALIWGFMFYGDKLN